MTDPSVLNKARKYCAYQERCQQELRDKLYGWGLHKRDVEAAISDMISEGFLNEQRFATTFAGGKFRMKQWGRVKIRRALQQKQVSPGCIREALEEIDNDEYLKSLQKVIRTCASRNNLKHPGLEKQRIARFVIGKGYESGLVWEMLGERK